LQYLLRLEALVWEPLPNTSQRGTTLPMKCAFWRWLICLLPLLLLLPEAVALKSAARIQEADTGDADDDGGDNSDDSQTADTNADDSNADQDSSETSDSAEGDETKDADQSDEQSDNDDNSDSQEQVTTTPVSVTKAAKQRRKVKNGLDISGLSKSLKDGGVEGLTRMLSAMKAARGNRNMDSEFHIKRDANGRAVYDFHDMFKKPEVTTLAPTAAIPVTIPGDLTKGLGKNLLKAQQSVATLPPPTEATEPEEKPRPSAKVAKVEGLPSPDDLMKQLLGALPPGMSNQIKLNVEKKQEEVKSTAPTTTSKALPPSPVKLSVEKKQEEVKSTVPTTTTSKALPPSPIKLNVEKKQEEVKSTVPTTTTKALPPSPIKLNVEKKLEVKSTQTTTTSQAPKPEPVVAVAHSVQDVDAPLAAVKPAPVKSALTDQQAIEKLQEELAKQAVQLDAMQTAQRSEAAELSKLQAAELRKVEQENSRLHAQIRKLVD